MDPKSSAMHWAVCQSKLGILDPSDSSFVFGAGLQVFLSAKIGMLSQDDLGRTTAAFAMDPDTKATLASIVASAS